MGMKKGLSRPLGVLRVILISLLAVVTPIVLIALCIIAWNGREGITYGGEVFPPLAEGFGWVMELGPLIFMLIMPVWQVYKLSKENLTASEMWKKLVNPSKSWYEVDRGGNIGNDSSNMEAELGRDNIAYSPEVPSSPPPYSEN